MTIPAPRTARGVETRRKILQAAEAVFAELGYAEASISRITDRAGIAQGTFYLYFSSKLDLFNELVEDVNRRVRAAMSEASSAATTRMARERAGFDAFFRFTAEHPSLYRIVREAEFVAPAALRLHYTRIVDGYIEGLREAKDAGELGDIDPTVAAWALMGVGEMIGMRWVLWGAHGSDDEAGTGHDADPLGAGTRQVPPEVFEQLMLFIRGALEAKATAPAAPSTPATGTERP